MNSFVIIGISDDPQPVLCQQARLAISNARVFSGGKRHHEIVAPMLPDGALWIDITAPIDDVFKAYARYDAEIVVFASGDPLFFGFANTVRRHLPDARVRLFPSFNSLQTLAHRLLMEYDDMRVVSLTGRPWPEFDRALIEGAPKIGVLTDKVHTPRAIVERMAQYGYDGYDIFVGEHLGNTDRERVISNASLDELDGIAQPNCMILRLRKQRQRRFGLPDKEFMLLDGRERMITKMPIRLLTLQALSLHNRRVLWDIGFCTGSVSIEARLLSPSTQVVAFEIRKEGKQLMETNSRRFGAPGIQCVIGDFMQVDLQALPRPDAIFIGGHGGRLAEIMQRACQYLAEGGCIVMNSVKEASRITFVNTAKTLGLSVGKEERIVLDYYNPITILKAEK